MNSNTVAVGILKAVGAIVAAGVVVVGCMAYFGSQMPEGSRFETACRAEVPVDQIEWCTAALDRTYRGPDDLQRKRNAAALWERERQEGKAATKSAG